VEALAGQAGGPGEGIFAGVNEVNEEDPEVLTEDRAIADGRNLGGGFWAEK